MASSKPFPLQRGIISVLQTPFDATGRLDGECLERLVENAIEGGVSGFLAPVVASEVAYLTEGEREAIVRRIATATRDRVSFIVGASSDDVATCRRQAALAEAVGASAYLVAVPDALYGEPASVIPFFADVAGGGSRLPLVIQDFQLNGPGLDVATIERLREALPTMVGIKIETVPAGPKYTAVREVCGPEFFIAGGWAVSQMIEALDRGVDAMMPESSMVRVYAAIYRLYTGGQRDRALRVFRSLLPVLAFTNQEVGTSIAFFKRLLVRKGIFRNDAMRWPGFEWDQYNSRIADELIERYLELDDALEAEPVQGR